MGYLDTLTMPHESKCVKHFVLIIFLTVLSISLVGDGLNDALNPKLRER